MDKGEEGLMKKVWMWIGSVVFLLVAFVSVARAELPKTINLQSVVYDQDGNVSGADFVAVSVHIVDEAGAVYFSEDHYDVPLVQGAMNLIIGESSGGIPLTALDPASGRKFVDILVDGSNPYDILPLSSVPYALWADKAVEVADDSIDGDSIKEGSIEFKHLSSEFNINEIGGTVEDGQIPENIVRQESFDLHLNSETSHQSTTITMDPASSFASQLGATVQIALDTLYANYAQEVASRQTAITNLTSQLTSSVSSLQSQITSHSSSISSLNSTVSNHTGRISSLESTVSQQGTRINALEGDPVQTQERALGWGAVDISGNSLYGYNVGSVTFYTVPQVSIGQAYYRVNFASPASSNAVAVSLTTMGPRTFEGPDGIELQNVSSSGFDVRCYEGDSSMSRSCAFHWVAFGI